MAAKAVVRDVGRVLGHPLRLRRPHRQAHPEFELGDDARDRAEKEPSSSGRYEDEEDVRDLIDLALSSRA
jgi:DNA polymerase III alpha subunit